MGVLTAFLGYCTGTDIRAKSPEGRNSILMTRQSHGLSWVCLGRCSSSSRCR